MSIECPDCGETLLEPVDTTTSNHDSGRARKGEHTGDIYECDKCEMRWLDNFLNGWVEVWMD